MVLPAPPALSHATARPSRSFTRYCPPHPLFHTLLPAPPALSHATARPSRSFTRYCPPLPLFRTPQFFAHEIAARQLRRGVTVLQRTSTLISRSSCASSCRRVTSPSIRLI
jgi:hypothetical protein